MVTERGRYCARPLAGGALPALAGGEGPLCRVLWQTGPRYREEIARRVGAERRGVEVRAFVDDMAALYASATLVVSRGESPACS